MAGPHPVITCGQYISAQSFMAMQVMPLLAAGKGSALPTCPSKECNTGEEIWWIWNSR